MKRTITGWILKDNLNKPFYVFKYRNTIGTYAATKASAFSDKSKVDWLVRVKITVETVEQKKRTPKLLKCASCGGSANTKSFENQFTKSTNGKRWHVVECSKCPACVLPEPTRKQAIERWNDQQKGKA